MVDSKGGIDVVDGVLNIGEKPLIEYVVSAEEQELELLKAKQEYFKTIPINPDFEFYVEWLESNNASLLSLDNMMILALGWHPHSNTMDTLIKIKFSKQAELIKKQISTIDSRRIVITPRKIVAIAFQYEVHFPEKISTAYLAVTGQALKYEDYSPVYQLYDEWALRPLVTLQQGVCLVHGMNPEVIYKGYDKEISSENPLFPIDIKQYKKSYELAISCVEGGTLKANKIFNMRRIHETKFDLNEIVNWAATKKRKPHPLLLELSGYKKESTENNVELSNHKYNNDSPMNSQEAAEKIEIPEFPSKGFYVDVLKKNSLDSYNTNLKDDQNLSLVAVFVLGCRLTDKYLSQEEYSILEDVRHTLYGGHPDSIPESQLQEVELLFQHIQYYPNKISMAYKDVTGKELDYELWSPVLAFYKKWSKLDLWTLEQAICLVHGMSPDNYTPYNRTLSNQPLFPLDRNKFNDTAQNVSVSIKAGRLEIHSTDYDEFADVKHEYVSPLEFIEWAISKGIKPHPLLLKYTEYQPSKECNNDAAPDSNEVDNEYNDSDNIFDGVFSGRTNNIKIMNQAIKEILLEKFPNADEIIQHLKDNIDKYPLLDADVPPIKHKGFGYVEKSGKKNYMPSTNLTKRIPEIKDKLRKNC